jgi:hypothetical protein
LARGTWESYRWGDLHVTCLYDNALGLGMPLGSAPTDGGEDTINVAHSLLRKDDVIPSRISDYGPSSAWWAAFA